MIYFSLGYPVPKDHHTWSQLMDILMSLYTDYNVDQKAVADVHMIRQMSEQFGFKVKNELNTSERIVLSFENPEKELIFKLKYL